MLKSKEIRTMFPSVDIGLCTICGGCMDMAPDVFCLNREMGYVEVMELVEYPEDEVNEAIKNCPVDCISWDG